MGFASLNPTYAALEISVTVSDAALHSITLSFTGDYTPKTFVIKDDQSGNHHVDLILA